jgi:2-oxoglutarate ferredoxin oxidoreductase subunit alpha
LYSEQISFAVGSEIPIVIVDVQRLGPSTGSATRGADGDINFLRWGNSGGLPVIVLAPVNAADCLILTMQAFNLAEKFRCPVFAADCLILTMQAFNLAEKFRCPVFIASNKEIAMTRESIDLDALNPPAIINRTSAPAGKPFLPFEISAGQTVSGFLPIGADIPVRQTSSTHGANGYITTDRREISQTLRRLKTKLESAVAEFSYHEFLTARGAKTLMIAYGVTARAAKAVYRHMRSKGKPVSLLILKTLWPVPEALIRRVAEPVKRIVVVEMNLGQYVREIERILEQKQIDFYGQMDGRLISPDKIEETISDG